MVRQTCPRDMRSSGIHDPWCWDSRLSSSNTRFILQSKTKKKAWIFSVRGSWLWFAAQQYNINVFHGTTEFVKYPFFFIGTITGRQCNLYQGISSWNGYYRNNFIRQIEIALATSKITLMFGSVTKLEIFNVIFWFQACDCESCTTVITDKTAVCEPCTTVNINIKHQRCIGNFGPMCQQHITIVHVLGYLIKSLKFG